ncbi:MAG: hypothetical protein U9O98_00775 [Asgard group archaeon]|nr:hypothetical protein [Asgard group archaeon]
MVFKESFKPFLSNLLEDVFKQALSDGIITPEESVLLAEIEIGIRDFEREIADCIEQSEKQEDFPSKDCFKKQLIASVRQLALKDGVLSQDEEKILTKLEEYFSQ